MNPEDFERVRRGVRALIGVPTETVIVPNETPCPCGKKCDETGSGYCSYECYKQYDEECE